MSGRARVVVVGGGIVGCSIAYHLAREGCSDVILLEQGSLTGGSTWHAAGLVGQLRSSRNITRMLRDSVELYARLEAETGQPTGWKASGGLRLASTPERMLENRRAATMARSFGLEMHLLSPQEALKYFPLMSLDGVVGASILPSDGEADPAQLTMAMAKGARNAGVRIMEKTRARGVVLSGRRVTAVETAGGPIECETLVNAAGMWGRAFGLMAGVNVPLIPVQHQYLVSGPMPGAPRGYATMRDPDNLVYYKAEGGGMLMGGYEHGPIPWNTDGPPADFESTLLEPNLEQFEPIMRGALLRTPAIEPAGVARFINGPESFTTDGNCIMGPAPELDNYYVCAGFNAFGIAAGGGAGKMLAEWILAGRPELDLWAIDIRRFGRYHRDDAYLVPRTSELYGKHYGMSWPHEEHDSAREVRTSPLYATLQARRAVFGQKFGWERPNWFAPPGVEPRDENSFGKPNWFDAVAAEHRAIRERVALIDMTSFSKFEVRGPGAFALLQRLAANDLDRPVGSLTYTQLCNERGGVECDLTIGRLASDRFYVVSGTAFATHDLDWIRRHAPADGSVILEDVTDTRSAINVCGPRSRDLLGKLTGADLSSAGFPFGTCREIEVAGLAVRALRVTYVGELGWELHVPVAGALALYEALVKAGGPLGVADAGYRALESCRLEKGYRYWSAELTPDYTPFEAGLGFCVRLDKGEFIGREALVRAKAGGPKRRLCTFTMEGYVPLFGGETILADGRVLGVLTAGGYGHTLGKAIAMGYVPSAESARTAFEIECFGESFRAVKGDDVLYDPRRARILA
ncbi:MAG: FAD-dependent oxidoreductase [Candidatus Coatesbacteria bacterium]